MKPAPFDYASPGSLAEALALLSSGAAEAMPIAGGQSLMPILAFRLAAPKLLVDLRGIPGLSRIAIEDDGVHLGALVRWRDIEDDTRLTRAHPLLKAAVSHVAHYQIRNRGTIGGSLAHADPAAELPGLAVACDATISIAASTGSRKAKAGEFFLGPLSTARTVASLTGWPSSNPSASGMRWGRRHAPITPMCVFIARPAPSVS